MRTARLVTLAAATAILGLAPAALGAPKVCNLVVDPKGDQHHFGDEAHPADSYYVSPDLDIVGGDIASNKRHVTAVLRLASLRQTDMDAPTGRSWSATFTVGGTTYQFRARQAQTGGSGTVWNETAGVGLGTAAVVYDYTNREIRFSAPVSVFKLKPGQQITGLTLTAGHFYGTGPIALSAPVAGYGAYAGSAGADGTLDTAKTTKAYTAGAASCVAVGR